MGCFPTVAHFPIKYMNLFWVPHKEDTLITSDPIKLMDVFHINASTSKGLFPYGYNLYIEKWKVVFSWKA